MFNWAIGINKSVCRSNGDVLELVVHPSSGPFFVKNIYENVNEILYIKSSTLRYNVTSYHAIARVNKLHLKTCSYSSRCVHLLENFQLTSRLILAEARKCTAHKPLFHPLACSRHVFFEVCVLQSRFVRVRFIFSKFEEIFNFYLMRNCFRCNLV